MYNRDLGSGKVMVIHRTFLKIPGHRQNGALQSFKWRDVSGSTRIGKIVKVLGINIIIHEIMKPHPVLMNATLMSILIILRVSCTGIGADP